MKITREWAKELYEVLKEEHEKIREENEENESQYPYREWERERKEVVERLRNLPELVKEATARLEVERPKRGRKPKLSPALKTILFLFARLTQRSNHDMEAILALLGPVQCGCEL